VTTGLETGVKRRGKRRINTAFSGPETAFWPVDRQKREG